ncbi:MAG TPA: Sec-independent protein translocase protein TatB [Rhizomicrobium sp.]|jgi:sec-independent protein translocase protein TatB
MFLDLSWSHILIVLIVALVVVGPKDLPRLMRLAGRWTAKARAMADQFRRSFDEMARQSELDELRSELESLRHERPFADIDRTLRAPVLPPPDPPAARTASPDQNSAAAPIAAAGPHE